MNKLIMTEEEKAVVLEGPPEVAEVAKPEPTKREVEIRKVTASSSPTWRTIITRTKREVEIRKLEAAIKKGAPLGRYGRKDEIGDAAVYLCSPAGQYITGTILDVDGGTGVASGRAGLG